MESVYNTSQAESFGVSSMRLRLFLAAAASCCVFLPEKATALVVVPPASNVNTSAPADDPGWANVGDRGVYLGNRWVITANHVGPGTTNFAGVGSFAAVSGSSVRLQNPTGQGLTTFTDLVLYRLAADPGLPSLSIAGSSAPIGASVTFIGNGRSVPASATETHWSVAQDPNNAMHDIWTEVPSGGDASGYKSTIFQKEWGTNRVEDDEPLFNEMDANHSVVANSGNGDVISLFSDFDDPNAAGSDATASEAEAQSGDSGSGVFYKDGSTWELAGITHAIGLYTDQPAFTAVYGDLTFFADLSAYRDQILAITAVPEASAGLLVLAGIAAMLLGIRWNSALRVEDSLETA
jgi:hypothetical protein